MATPPPKKQAAAASKQGMVRPLTVQKIAKQMGKLMMQRDLLTSPQEAAQLTQYAPPAPNNNPSSAGNK